MGLLLTERVTLAFTNANPYSNIVHRMYVYCTCVKTYLHVELYLKGRITRYKPTIKKTVLTLMKALATHLSTWLTPGVWVTIMNRKVQYHIKHCAHLEAAMLPERLNWSKCIGRVTEKTVNTDTHHASHNEILFWKSVHHLHMLWLLFLWTSNIVFKCSYLLYI